MIIRIVLAALTLITFNNATNAATQSCGGLDFKRMEQKNKKTIHSLEVEPIQRENSDATHGAGKAVNSRSTATFEQPRPNDGILTRMNSRGLVDTPPAPERAETRLNGILTRTNSRGLVNTPPERANTRPLRFYDLNGEVYRQFDDSAKLGLPLLSSDFGAQMVRKEVQRNPLVMTHNAVELAGGDLFRDPEADVRPIYEAQLAVGQRATVGGRPVIISQLDAQYLHLEPPQLTRMKQVPLTGDSHGVQTDAVVAEPKKPCCTRVRCALFSMLLIILGLIGVITQIA